VLVLEGTESWICGAEGFVVLCCFVVALLLVCGFVVVLWCLVVGGWLFSVGVRKYGKFIWWCDSFFSCLG